MCTNPRRGDPAVRGRAAETQSRICSRILSVRSWSCAKHSPFALHPREWLQSTASLCRECLECRTPHVYPAHPAVVRRVGGAGTRPGPHATPGGPGAVALWGSWLACHQQLEARTARFFGVEPRHVCPQHGAVGAAASAALPTSPPLSTPPPPSLITPLTHHVHPCPCRPAASPTSPRRTTRC